MIDFRRNRFYFKHRRNATQASLRRFASCRRGNVALIFAMATVPCFLLVGGTIDYSAASAEKAKLDAFADSAALYTVSKTAMGWTAGTAKTNGTNVFNSQALTARLASVTSITLTVTDVGATRTTLLNYTASVPTRFMNIAGFQNVPIKGTATASSAVPIYADFYLLLDNTPSMGIGATPADVTTLQNNTPDRCAFACHDISAGSNDYYSLAKRLGVTTRIDVVRQAAQNLTDSARASQATANQFRMAIYSFGVRAENPGLTAVAPLSSDLAAVKSNASALDLMTIPYQGYNNDQITDFDRIFSDMNSALPNAGDGSASSSPQKYLFFVSDGVADAFYPATCQGMPVGGGRCQEPIKVSNCTAIKNRGIKIAVLYTTYQPVDNGWYIATVAPFNQGPWAPSPNSQIAQNMQACASPGLYFEVGPSQGISQAMDALFQKIVKYARLTN